MRTQLFTNLEESDFATLFTWRSPERHWVKRERAWFVSYSLFFVIVIAIAVLLGEYVLIVAIVAFAFLWFVQASVPPETIEHRITNTGINTFGQLFKWKNINHFWFSKKHNLKYLNLEVVEDDSPNYIKRFSLIVNGEDDVQIFKKLITKIDYGDKIEIAYNPLTFLLYGKHLTISNYLPDNLKPQTDEISLPL